MKLLITGAFRWTPEQKQALRDMGWELVFVEREDGQLPDGAFDADAVVCNWLFVNHDIRSFPNLKRIQLLSAGLDRLPLEYIRQKGIEVFNARGVYSIPMAEFAVGGVLQLYKGSRFFYENQKDHCWNKKRDLLELFGKRVLVVGTGNVGYEVAKRFRAFTDAVYGVDLYPSDDPIYRQVFPLECLNAQLALSDIVILTLPLTDETHGMFDVSRFQRMKCGAVLVNIARGGIVDEAALCDALDGKLYGAVLDVFSTEPLDDSSPLWEKENLILTPHNSFVSKGNDSRMWEIIKTNLSSR